MKELVEFIVKSIVSKPDNVKVEEVKQDSEVTLTLIVDPLDMGIVIGKMGQTIKSIRRVLAVAAMADNVRVNLQLKEQTVN